MTSSKDEKLTDFKVVALKESIYLKPLRLEFKLNDKAKYWDFLQVHDSVSILIYNKSRNVVVLVKQFRPSLYAGHIPNLQEGATIDPSVYPVSNGYSLELCAGIVDKNLPLEQVAAEEVLEECGYQVPANRLRQIFRFINVGVTGHNSNIFYLEVEDSEKVGQGGGLHLEGEYIEVIEMPIAEFRKYVFSVNHNSPSGLAAAALWFFSVINPSD